MINELFGNQDWRNQHPVDLLTIGKNFGERFGEPKEGSYPNRLITGILPNGEGIGVFEPDFEEGTELSLDGRSRSLNILRRNIEFLWRIPHSHHSHFITFIKS